MDSWPRVRHDRAVSWPLRPRVGWIAWALAAAAAGIYPPTLYLGLAAPANVPAVLRLGWFGVVAPVVGITYCLVGALIIRRHPRHPVGWLAAAGGFCLSLTLFAGAYAAYSLGSHQLPGAAWMGWLRDWLWIPAFQLLFVLLPTVFPDGRLPSRWWSLLAWAGAAGTVTQVAAATRDWSGSGSAPTLRIATVMNMLHAFSSFLLLAALLAAIAAVAVRYRRSRGEARRQLTWFMAAMVLQGLLWAGSLVPALAYHLAPYQTPYFEVAIPFALLAMPLTIAVAILRERLYDLDLLLSRGLVYAALAAFITAGYLLIVVGAGLLVGTGGRPNLPLSILSTALVAVLFQPVRARVDRLANRLVYGAPGNPYEALAELSRSTAAGSVEDVLPRVAQAIATGTRSDRARIELLLPAGHSRAATWPAGATGPFAPALSVNHQGEMVGRIEIGGGSDPGLTEALTGQAGLVLRNLRLAAELDERLQEIGAQAAELAASRTRLVTAQETERRRLERDLHDGVQQELVALIAKLRLARNQLARDPVLATGTLAELQAGIERALTDLRQVAHGIHPAVLGSRGLVEAVEAMAGRMPLGVRVEADDRVRGLRYAPEIEGAAYFVVAEGLANVLKHAAAGQATVTIEAENSHLRLEVADDGHGFPAGTAESGLRGLRDRVEALGGRLGVSSQAGGTRLEATLPARQRPHA